MTFDPEVFPDETLSEAVEREDTEEWGEEDYEEMQAELIEYEHRAQLASMAAMAGRLVADDKITLREYGELTESLIEYEDEWDVVL